MPRAPSGWFPLTHATVYFDHPFHAPYEHTLNIDFANADQGPSSRVAVELTAELRTRADRADRSGSRSGRVSGRVSGRLKPGTELAASAMLRNAFAASIVVPCVLLAACGSPRVGVPVLFRRA